VECSGQVPIFCFQRKFDMMQRDSVNCHFRNCQID
jgi:hypothetical protein